LDWLSDWTIYRLHQGIFDEAADVDREQIGSGVRFSGKCERRLF
jgi:hypothetical protein